MNKSVSVLSHAALIVSGLTVTALAHAGFLNGLAGYTQGQQKDECMKACYEGDAQCYQECEKAFPSQKPNTFAAPSYQQSSGILGTLINSRSGSTVTGRFANECICNVLDRNTSVIVEGVCPPSMNFR